MSSDRENLVITALLLGVLIATAGVTYGYYSMNRSRTQEPTIAGLQLRSTSVALAGLGRADLSVTLRAVVFNPYPVGAVLDSASYSVYANGHYLGSGETTRAFSLAAGSSQTFVFPISVSWDKAFSGLGYYLVGLGSVALEVNGTAGVSVGGILLSAPFEFTAS